MTTNETDLTPEQMDEALSAARVILRRRVDELEQAQAAQPARLIEARAKAEAARKQALAEEPWTDVMTGFPTYTGGGDLSGMLPMPTIEGKELFGTRLAFDLLGCCEDEAHVKETFDEYFSMVREPDHLFLVAFAALDTIANHVMPALLDTLEHQASDYDSRVRLADAARNAWTARVNDLRGPTDQSAPEGTDDPTH
jgi:hypothetical protein